MGKILAKRLTSFSRRSSAGSDAGATACSEDLRDAGAADALSPSHDDGALC
jgi:hypothetical protein